MCATSPKDRRVESRAHHRDVQIPANHHAKRGAAHANRVAHRRKHLIQPQVGADCPGLDLQFLLLLQEVAARCFRRSPRVVIASVFNR